MDTKRFKLNKLSGDALAQRQMKGIKGGIALCQCACAYANRGGSSTQDNGTANRNTGKHSPDGGDVFLPDIEVHP